MVKFLPLRRSATIWMTMATTRRTTTKRKPFHVSAARSRRIPATSALIRTAFLEGSSASTALAILRTNRDMKARRNAARP